MSQSIEVKGGKKFERDVAEKTARWCIPRIHINEYSFNLVLSIRVLNDCYGHCTELRNNVKNTYNIVIANNQSLRDFVMTIIHEMIHVRQYLEGKWVDDGERECTEFETFLTDEIWKEDIL